jgi:hypothetical protein
MKILDSITKRDILHGARKATSAEILTFAESYYREGQWSDAIDFFARAEATDRLAALAAELVQEGESFLLLKLIRLGGKVSDAQILECAQRAEALGKTRYAIMAYEKLGDTQKVESLRDSIAQDGDIIALREAETFIAVNQEEIQTEATED